MSSISLSGDTTTEKATLRTEMRIRRKRIPPEERYRAGEEVLEHLGEVLGLLRENAVIAGYLPIGAEIDCTPLLDMLHGQGLKTALPAVVNNETPLVFRRWSPGEPLNEGRRNTLEPEPGAERVEPDILLIPLLAFDAEGWRLGQGGGFYDRTLEALRGRKKILAIGLAFEAQRVESLPRTDHDQKLDGVITEKGFHMFSGAGPASS